MGDFEVHRSLFAVGFAGLTADQCVGVNLGNFYSVAKLSRSAYVEAVEPKTTMVSPLPVKPVSVSGRTL